MDYFHIRNIDEVLSTGGKPSTVDQIAQLKKGGFSTIVSAVLHDSLSFG